jgi:hypothetical protein
MFKHLLLENLGTFPNLSEENAPQSRLPSVKMTYEASMPIVPHQDCPS